MLSGALAAAAIPGREACALRGSDAPLDRLSIGLGMMPRGEAGLVFANIGPGLAIHGERVVDPAFFAAVVLVVLAITVVMPPALQWSLRRSRPRPHA